MATSDTVGGFLQRKADMEKISLELDKLMAKREAALVEVHTILNNRVLNQNITYLNMQTRKKHISYMFLSHATLQLKIKMYRRNLFYLRHRRDKIRKELELLVQNESAGNNNDNGAGTSTPNGTGTSAA
jgi:hypothetical protein